DRIQPVDQELRCHPALGTQHVSVVVDPELPCREICDPSFRLIEVAAILGNQGTITFVRIPRNRTDLPVGAQVGCSARSLRAFLRIERNPEVVVAAYVVAQGSLYPPARRRHAATSSPAGSATSASISSSALCSSPRISAACTSGSGRSSAWVALSSA